MISKIISYSSYVSFNGFLIIFLLCSCSSSANQISLLVSINSNLTKNMQNKNRTEPIILTVQPQPHSQHNDDNETSLRMNKRNEEFRQSYYNYGNQRNKKTEVKRQTDYYKDSWVGAFLIFGIIGVCVICCICDQCADPECQSTWIVNIPSGPSNRSSTNNAVETRVGSSPTQLLMNEIRQTWTRHEGLFGLPFQHMTRPPLLEDNPPAYPAVTQQSLDRSNPPSYSSAWVRIGCLKDNQYSQT